MLERFWPIIFQIASIHYGKRCTISFYINSWQFYTRKVWNFLSLPHFFQTVLFNFCCYSQCRWRWRWIFLIKKIYTYESLFYRLGFLFLASLLFNFSLLDLFLYFPSLFIPERGENDNKFGLFDFQKTRRGKGATDLAFFLATSLDIELRWCLIYHPFPVLNA